jgi:ankyrin repeat protein
MHVAALNGHVEVVRELLKMGGNPNTPDKVCRTKERRCFKSGSVLIRKILT